MVQISAIIRVTVINRTTLSPVPDLNVSFSINDPDLESFFPLKVRLTRGVAQTVFRTKFKTGKVNLTIVTPFDSLNEFLYIQGYPDTLTFVGTPEWLVANDTANKSVVALVALNNSNPIPMMNIKYSLLDPTMGILSKYSDLTDEFGRTTVLFTPSTKSGDAVIQANVSYPGGWKIVDYVQKIDHATPWQLYRVYAPGEALVGDQYVIITAKYTDQYGNPIDNRRFTENVNFTVSSPSSPNLTTEAGFWNDGSFIPVNVTNLDSTGNATVRMRMDIREGKNKVNVHLNNFPLVADYPFDILGISSNVPVLIEQQISPSKGAELYPHIPADGQTVFNITYTLRDIYGNAVSERYFWMNTSLGESRLLKTNSSGMVKTTYGPKIRTDLINITATAVDSISEGVYATTSQPVEFTSLEPVMMVMTANPQFLPSWDVPGGATSTIKAVVMDSYGNPVKNQEVQLTVVPNSWSYNYVTNGVTGPKWKNNSSSTISLTTLPQEDPRDSYASADFQPGYLPGFGYPQVHDSARVTANWNGYTQTAVINWTNVPFLSVSTNVTPYVAAWNDIITVNLKVDGNGYALKPKPIDVVLVIDRSGSMSGSDISPSRMSAAKTAARALLTKWICDLIAIE